MPHSEGVGAEHPRTHLYIILPVLLFIPIVILDSLIFYFSTFLVVYIPLIIRIVLCLFFLTGGIIFLMLSHRAVLSEESEDKKLVKTGLYAHVRHPMYLSEPLIFIGFILLTFSLISIIPLVIYVILFRSVMNFEEKELEKIFGQAYLDYKKKVLRWLPRPTPAKFKKSN